MTRTLKETRKVFSNEHGTYETVHRPGEGFITRSIPKEATANVALSSWDLLAIEKGLALLKKTGAIEPISLNALIKKIEMTVPKRKVR